MTGTQAERIRRTRATVRERPRAENHPDVLGVMLLDCNQIGEIRDVAGFFATAAQAGIVLGLKYRAGPAHRQRRRDHCCYLSRTRSSAAVPLQDMADTTGYPGETNHRAKRCRVEDGMCNGE